MQPMELNPNPIQIDESTRELLLASNVPGMECFDQLFILVSFFRQKYMEEKMKQSKWEYECDSIIEDLVSSETS
jgi:hypothetical protein